MLVQLGVRQVVDERCGAHVWGGNGRRPTPNFTCEASAAKRSSGASRGLGREPVLVGPEATRVVERATPLPRHLVHESFLLHLLPDRGRPWAQMALGAGMGEEGDEDVRL